MGGLTIKDRCDVGEHPCVLPGAITTVVPGRTRGSAPTPPRSLVKLHQLSLSTPPRGYPMYQTYQLSHADAQKIIAAIQQKLEQEGKGAAIAVADAHGELLAF